MSKKILYCASTASHILNFHLPYLRFFKEQGWQVDVAVAAKVEIPYTDRIIEIPLEKNILALRNLQAVRTFQRLLAENRYDVISVHTTLAGAAARLAVLLKRRRTEKVVYTSHGYFFNGGRSLSGQLFLRVEKLLAPVTDILMVMNTVDHTLAVKHKLGKKIAFIPGMGVDLTRFAKVDSEEQKRMKASAGYKPDDILIVYAAEMSKRKNQGELIRAFAVAAATEPSLKLLLAGDGALKQHYQEIVHQHGLDQRIHFLGHVSDMAALYKMCDIAVSTSRSEGLPFNIMEAMASGLPVAASDIKGHKDLLSLSSRGQISWLYQLGDEKGLANMLLMLGRDEGLRERTGRENSVNVQPYALGVVRPMIVGVYDRPNSIDD